MVQEQQELRSVNWNEVFAFTHLFKCFRMAIQPSKLALCAAALVVLFLSGWVLDRLWSLGGSYVMKDEIALAACSPSAQFDKVRGDWLDGRLAKAAECKADAKKNAYDLEAFLRVFDAGVARLGTLEGEALLKGNLKDKRDTWNKEKDKTPPEASAAKILEEAKKQGTGWSTLLSDAREALDSEISKAEKILDQAREATEDAIKKKDTKKKENQEAFEKHLACARQALTARKLAFRKMEQDIRGEHISAALATYEWNCVRGAVTAAARVNFTGGLGYYKDLLEGRQAVKPMTAQDDAAQAPILPVRGADVLANLPPDRSPGVFLYGLLAYRGALWLIQTHWVYATLYLLIALGVTALFGGAVNRIAALHFAREEKISVGQALKFSAGKFFSFFTAPLIPIAIIFVLGGLMALGGLLFNAPVFDWFGGLLFLLALVAGLGTAFLLVGLVGGAGLMYPTIAVEGSDSFDAISRSYSYVFARPWRALLYGGVAAVYGALTYLFVRLFVFVALVTTHWFVGFGVFRGGDSLAPKADRLDVIWTRPTFDCLFGNFNWDAMGFWERIPAFMIGVWVFLMAAVVAGYLLSYAASATNVIYFLLRRRVDATDLDDVYVEETPEEAPALATATVPAAPASAPAAPAPAPESQTPPAAEGDAGSPSGGQDEPAS